MRLIADANILVRVAAHDNSTQEKIAKRIMREAELVAIPRIALCEFVWVMQCIYKFSLAQNASAIRALMEADNVELDHAAAQAGLAILEADGDFADGVIAHEGKWLGGVTFVSFVKEAVALLKKKGQAAKLL